ncbi:unnamed protein product [Clonostachys solani]|uniref:Pisatin demethylase n=1 Tax=Clonostachys solani TaxID=160281 RepID=A0A9P0EGV2_9HYPO|nr:unnamed protein product [Clonostachys solani]
MASHTDLLHIFLRDWKVHIRPVLLIGVISVACIWLVRQLASPLNKYPGPPLAAWTNWYRFYLVLTGRYHLKIKEFHEKYGPVVRIGPNTLDLDYPELTKTIYSIDDSWLKTDFYHGNSIKVNGKIVYTMFSIPSNEENQIMKRPIAKHYSPGAVLALEPLLDGVMGQLCDELDQRFVKTPTGSKPCDLGSWIAYCIWDLIGAASFSKDFGFMAHGADFDGTIGIADKALDYFAAIGQMPFLDFILDKNPIYRLGPPSLGNIQRVALERVAARVQGKDRDYNPAVPDYLHHFLAARKENPELVDDGMLLGYLFINLVAGADTTALSIRAVIYFLLKNPKAYERVKKEIRGAKLGRVAKYHEAKALPYLEAVIRETMRLHPGVSMLLERYVPEGGLKLPDGSLVPPQTSVGLNAYVTHRNKDIYGPDADEYKPERWLRAAGESEEAYQQRLKVYLKYDFTFGAGPRICLGRHVAVIKTYKLVATLISNYDIELDHPDREWQIHCGWFLRQYGIICNLKKVR